MFLQQCVLVCQGLKFWTLFTCACLLEKRHHSDWLELSTVNPFDTNDWGGGGGGEEDTLANLSCPVDTVV